MATFCGKSYDKLYKIDTERHVVCVPVKKSLQLQLAVLQNYYHRIYFIFEDPTRIKICLIIGDEGVFPPNLSFLFWKNQPKFGRVVNQHNG